MILLPDAPARQPGDDRATYRRGDRPAGPGTWIITLLLMLVIIPILVIKLAMVLWY